MWNWIKGKGWGIPLRIRALPKLGRSARMNGCALSGYSISSCPTRNIPMRLEIGFKSCVGSDFCLWMDAFWKCTAKIRLKHALGIELTLRNRRRGIAKTLEPYREAWTTGSNLYSDSAKHSISTGRFNNTKALEYSTG